MDEVLELEADVSAAVILLDRARVMIEAGLHRDADASLRQAGELFRAARLFKDVGEVELARAECALLDGEVAAARRLASSARDRFRRRGNERWRRDAELLLLQADLAAGRPGRAAGPGGAAAGRGVPGRGAEHPGAHRPADRRRGAAARRRGRRGRRGGPRRRHDPRRRPDLGPAADQAGTRPAALGQRRSSRPPAGRSGPAWPSWPGTRRGSAASTCRPRARCTAGRWPS